MLTAGHVPGSSFIRTFARPVSLDSLSPNISPTYFAVDVPKLSEALFDSTEPLHLVRHTGADATVLDQAEVAGVLSTLNQAFPVRKVRRELRILEPSNDRQIGTLAIGKTRISLRGFAIPEIEDIHIEPVNSVAGENRSVPLKRHIDQDDLYTILFDDVAIAYLDGTLYRDDSIADGQQFLSYIRTEAGLSTVTGEKGTFLPDQASFHQDSIFRIIVDRIAGRDELLICDDLGDEWADFIGIDGTSQPKTISFYHAKHDPLTLGASALHIVVSQAIKNLGRINPSSDEITAKLPKWERAYRNDTAETSIRRVLRGDIARVPEQIRSALLAPDTIRRVFIVTSSLSRKEVEQVFTRLNAGEAPTPHFVQLYWLLMSYFSACTEKGAFPYLVCQP